MIFNSIMNFYLFQNYSMFFSSSSLCPTIFRIFLEILLGCYHKPQFKTPHESKSTHLFCFATFLSTLLDIDIPFLSRYSNRDNTIPP